MIVITGAAGFIGSVLTTYLNNKGYHDLLLVDDFSKQEKNPNLSGKKFSQKMERRHFLPWFEENATQVDFVFHIGARTDTTEFNEEIFQELNVDYSKAIWKVCSENRIGLVYASSAATYGLGEYGYKDDHEVVEKLQPLNPYGESKNEFDKWVLKQNFTPPHWYGLKFFNVYGPNEYHKGRMASVIFHAFHQILDTRQLKLFKSHHKDYEHGQQKRDFIYVKDLVKVCSWLMAEKPRSGLYNLGSGRARTFLDLAHLTFAALDTKVAIEFIPTPEDIRDKYQYFTEAEMDKLKQAGYPHAFTSLEEGIEDYVVHYLKAEKYY
jgi:ADP-L-glycero-D-manno-heptose 6-epimerase